MVNYNEKDFKGLTKEDFSPLFTDVQPEHVGVFQNTDKKSDTLYDQEIHDICIDIQMPLYQSRN